MRSYSNHFDHAHTTNSTASNISRKTRTFTEKTSLTTLPTINADHKLRLCLSTRALDILEMDAASFADGMNRTGFINEVLERCTADSEASIVLAAEKYRQSVETALLESMKKAEVKSAVMQKGIQTLTQEYEKKLECKELAWPKGESSFIFRFSNKNCEAFYGEDDGYQECDGINDVSYPLPDCYKGKMAYYIKAILEDYASHTIYEREALYFHEVISQIQMAKETGHIVRLALSVPGKGRAVWDVRVYDILPDDGGMYRYVVGLSAPKAGTKGEEQIASLRISRIRDWEILDGKSARSGRLSKEDRRRIEKRMAESRVQFLLSSQEEIVVHLTDKGKAMYEKILYMRPKAAFIDESVNYHFSCSRLQAEYYFKKFGAEAMILQPAELRDKFALFYQQANGLYGDVTVEG